MLAAGRTRNFVILDEVHHLLLGPCIYASFDRNVMLSAEILDQLVCTETLVAFLTVHQRIGESAKMAGCYPCLRIHQDCTVYTDIVRGFLNKFLPPCALYVVLEFNAKVTVVPGICKTSINF